jgi:hypothetical protein
MGNNNLKRLTFDDFRQDDVEAVDAERARFDEAVEAEESCIHDMTLSTWEAAELIRGVPTSGDFLSVSTGEFDEDSEHAA